MDMLSLIIGLVVGPGVAWQFRRPESTDKQQRLTQIMKLVTKQEKITNNDVEDLLHVSYVTAGRYLEELELRGSLKQVGKTGKFVYYEVK